MPSFNEQYFAVDNLAAFAVVGVEPVTDGVHGGARCRGQRVVAERKKRARKG